MRKCQLKYFMLIVLIYFEMEKGLGYLLTETINLNISNLFPKGINNISFKLLKSQAGYSES